MVSIKVDSTRAFDTGWNQSSQATGFVVDAKQGLILTNRHVVTPGPVRAEALFLNQEEVDLLPVYRDPVHDFGLFGFEIHRTGGTRTRARGGPDRPRNPGRRKRRR